jgi:hypothetical protein
MRDTRHRHAIDQIVTGTEDAPRYRLSWDEQDASGHKMRCSMHVCSGQLARRIVFELFMHDDYVTKVDFRSVS